MSRFFSKLFGLRIRFFYAELGAPWTAASRSCGPRRNQKRQVIREGHLDAAVTTVPADARGAAPAGVSWEKSAEFPGCLKQLAGEVWDCRFIEPGGRNRE